MMASPVSADRPADAMSPEREQAQHRPSAEPSPETLSLNDDKWKVQDEADEASIRRILSQTQDIGGGNGPNISSFSHDNPIDQSGKADDAFDFEDISDDDLPEEEPAAAPTGSFELPGLTDDGGTSHDTDDLFGEGRESSPFDPVLAPSSPQEQPEAPDTANPDIRPESSFADNNDFSFDAAAQEGQNQDPNIPPAITSVEDFVKQKWPEFRQGIILNWNEILVPRPAEFRAAKPARKPKPLLLNKLSLDIATDQEKVFRVPGYGAQLRKEAGSDGLVHIRPPGQDAGSKGGEFDLDAESDDELICGLTLQHIDTICYDFDDKITHAEAALSAEMASREAERKRGWGEADDEWDAMFMDEPPPKRKRVIPSGLPDVTQFETPSLGAYEQLTRAGSKRVLLDLNDPNLHVIDEEAERPAKRTRVGLGQGPANGNLAPKTLGRFNIANDEAYELLKEAHQDKVRATIGNIIVDHALPALRLTWPYYKTKLVERQDQFHRPPFRVRKYVGRPLEFSKRGVVKKKAQKGKARDVFRETKDLTLRDNSSAVLFEYSERIPTVLSKFGMGNRIINYYRKRPEEDKADPEKKQLGELQILLPEDRSPFAIFGTVDPGETVPTLHNQMYRAPLFQHKPREGDFILGRSSTGKDGSQWYMRKMDHIFVVGQTFPSVEVPGPHSRKVTTTSKNRTKMLSYRIMRKHPEGMLFTGDITRHLAGTNDGQNRQKLKEFLKYVRPDKDNNKPGYWSLPPDQPLMNEEGIRALIKPEDTCLIDGMNLGMKIMEDAGFDPRLAVIQDNEDGEADGEGGKAKKAGEKGEESLAEKMAPWKTSKAFIDACTGKAMLQLHGEGDPTGHGLGFSFIRTSMKGGYLEQLQNGPLSSSADAIEKQKRDNNGHAYNVKKQEQAYKSGISEIWGKQKTTLSDGTVHDDDDVLQIADEDERFNNTQGAPTPAAAPDDSVSQFSGFTSASRQSRKRLRIVRHIQGLDGNIEERVEVVEDPVVISQYIKRRNELEAADREYVPRVPATLSVFPPEPDPVSGLVVRITAYSLLASWRSPLLGMSIRTVRLPRSEYPPIPPSGRGDGVVFTVLTVLQGQG